MPVRKTLTLDGNKITVVSKNFKLFCKETGFIDNGVITQEHFERFKLFLMIQGVRKKEDRKKIHILEKKEVAKQIKKLQKEILRFNRNIGQLNHGIRLKKTQIQKQKNKINLLY